MRGETLISLNRLNLLVDPDQDARVFDSPVVQFTASDLTRTARASLVMPRHFTGLACTLRITCFATTTGDIEMLARFARLGVGTSYATTPFTTDISGVLAVSAPSAGQRAHVVLIYVSQQTLNGMLPGDLVVLELQLGANTTATGNINLIGVELVEGDDAFL